MFSFTFSLRFVLNCLTLISTELSFRAPVFLTLFTSSELYAEFMFIHLQNKFMYLLRIPSQLHHYNNNNIKSWMTLNFFKWLKWSAGAWYQWPLWIPPTPINLGPLALHLRPTGSQGTHRNGPGPCWALAQEENLLIHSDTHTHGRL